MTTIGFLGTGNMGTAIIKGIRASAMAETARLFAYDPDAEKLDALRDYDVTPCESESELARACHYLFLAIKPQMFETVLPKIAAAIDENTVLVSIAAGMTVPYIQAKTRADARVVLVMPNTPLLLGEGATALAPAANVPEEDANFVRSIFDACGKTAILPPDKMKEIIAINSSSPAFIYLFAKAFLEYAKGVAIDDTAAKMLFAQTLTGAAKMITDSGKDVDTLIEQVSSKGGTTVAGLEELNAGDLMGVVKKACEACTRRAYELSQ